MKKLWFLIGFSFWTILGFGQTREEGDSLKLALANTRQDQDRVMILAELSRNYLPRIPDSSLLIAKEGLALAQRIDFPKGEARMLFHMAWSYRVLGDITKSMQESLRGQQMAENLGFRQEEILCNYNIGYIYNIFLNDPHKAMAYFKKANQLTKHESEDFRKLYGLVFEMNLGNTYRNLGQLDSAALYYDTALAHIRDNIELNPNILMYLGLLQQQKKNYQQAHNYYRKSAVTLGPIGTAAELYYYQATCFQETNQLDSCIFYARKSFASAEKIGYQLFVLRSSTLLAQIYEARNNPEALYYYKKAKLANDEVYGERKVVELQRVITEEMQRQQEAEKQKTAYENRVRQYALLGGLAVVLLIALLLYRNNRFKQKSNARLQKQNRELEIEAALERVRSRTMAMHESAELSQVVAVLYEEVLALGFSDWGNTIMIFHEENQTIQNWVSAQSKQVLPSSFSITGMEQPDIAKIWEVWRNEIPRSTLSLAGEEKERYDQYLFSQTDFRNLPEEIKEGNRKEKEAHFTFAWMKYGLIAALDSKSPLSDENFVILQRFAKVFEQTYTRFLDLKKAEAQAREAQIEAALERIRSRTMAMQRTSELNEVVGVIFEELNRMGFDTQICSIGIYDRETKGADWWSYIAGGDLPGSYHFPYLETRLFKETYDAWIQKKPYHFIEIYGEEKDEQDRITFEKTDWKKLPEAVKNSLMGAITDGLKASYISMNCGMLEIVGDNRLTEDDIKLLQRFTKVIDLTYTRVDDLQKAEAQAREAIKQASLDRVRAEIASMRSTQDLERITPLVWQELTTLGVHFIRCGIFIIDEEHGLVHSYLSTPDGHSLAAMEMSFGSNQITDQVVAHWQKEEVFREHWDKQQFVDWMQAMVEQHQVQSREQYQGAALPPESLYLHFIPFKQGMLYVGNIEELSAEEIDLVQTLAAAFAIAYTRYDDFRRLEDAKKRIEATLDELTLTQAQLIQSEKMASLGELTAGIAHEIQNPLNFVNNYSEVNVELIEDITDELEKGSIGEVKNLLLDLKDNESKIHHHGQRADSIVRSMMQHSRTNSGTREPTNLNALADEYLRLAYQSMKAKDGEFVAEISTDFDKNLPLVNVVPQDLGRVLLNVINNAFQAVNEKRLQGLQSYQPAVKVTTRKLENKVEISIADNGPGIPESIKDKIFQPFFTTKPTGQGTGLGLSLAYDIVKAHGGELRVESVEGKGTEFSITLPVV